jgi:hypothetical protein
MTKLMIRVAAEISDDMISAFPQLHPTVQQPHTTLTGDIADQQELQGVLNWLASLGIDVLEVVTIPD